MILKRTKKSLLNSLTNNVVLSPGTFRSKFRRVKTCNVSRELKQQHNFCPTVFSSYHSHIELDMNIFFGFEVSNFSSIITSFSLRRNGFSPVLVLDSGRPSKSRPSIAAINSSDLLRDSYCKVKPLSVRDSEQIHTVEKPNRWSRFELFPPVQNLDRGGSVITN